MCRRHGTANESELNIFDNAQTKDTDIKVYTRGGMKED